MKTLAPLDKQHTNDFRFHQGWDNFYMSIRYIVPLMVMVFGIREGIDIIR